MPRNLYFLAMLLITLGLFASSVRADQIMIFGDSSEPPKSFISEQGEPEGLIIEVVRFIAKEAGIKLKIQLLPWNRAYRHAARGDGMIMSLSKTPERKKIFDYTDAIFYDQIVLVTHSNRIPNYTSIKDLKGKTLALNLGSSYGVELDTAIKEGLFQVHRVSNRKSWYRMLLRGRVDGVIAAQGTAGVYSILHKDPKLWERRHEFRIFKRLLKRDPNYIGVPKSLSSPDLIRKLNFAISKYWLKVNKTKNQ